MLTPQPVKQPNCLIDQFALGHSKIVQLINQHQTIFKVCCKLPGKIQGSS